MLSLVLSAPEPTPRAPRVLLTSVCRPLGERHGDGPSVGYELLFGQVTRAQGVFSPRSNNVQYSLDYLAENIDCPVTVLHYPSRRELVRELQKGYDYVGIAFVLATFHRMKEVVSLVRAHAPGSRIVLGGYGTVLGDDVLGPLSDHVCREDGVAYLRRLLDEPPLSMPYRHPMVVSRMRVFGIEASRTGMVFAGLGCPNGCDFCCTSHFFKRKHVKLLPTGRDIHRVIARYVDADPGMALAIFDEDFLLNRKRAMELRDAVLADGRPLSIFAFASVKALSQYSVTEILEMGIDGVWMGYEGTRSGYAKQAGRPFAELVSELRDHGIAVLASMIVGLPYQTPEIISAERDQLLAMRPTLCQFLIYGPTPGTPFWDRVIAGDLLHRDLLDDRERYYHRCTGFSAMVKHPTMAPHQIERAQQDCFSEDFRRLGPAIYRSVDVWLQGYQKLRDSASAFLRAKADRFAREIRKAYPVFLAGRRFGPTRQARDLVADLEARVHAALGPPTPRERALTLLSPALVAWSALKLKTGTLQHPRLTRHTYRTPGDSLPARLWRRLSGSDPSGCAVDVELRPMATVWVRVEGKLLLEGAERLAARLQTALAKRREQLVIDLSQLAAAEERAAKRLADALASHGRRIRVLTPHAAELTAIAALFALHR